MRLNLNSDSALFLYELDDDTLDSILSLTFEELDKYIYSLIDRFYPGVTPDSKIYKELSKAYKASFALEKIYRLNSLINNNYTAIYTKTGLVREVVLDMYEIGNEKVVFN